jgi:ATP/ADP translocase
MTINYADRIFWLRVGFGVGSGALAQLLFDSDYVSGILLAVIVYLVTFYMVKALWGKQMKPEDQRKLYTAGLGSFALLFLFFWIFLFTLGVHYLHL